MLFKLVVVVLIIPLNSILAQQFCSLDDQTVRCMFTDLKSVPQQLPGKIKTLDLRFNKIRHIPRGSFRNLTQVTSLLLNNNQLHRLRNGVFDGLQSLQYLYLYKNYIQRIDHSVFQDLPNLEHLYLHSNKIKVLSPNQFTDLPNLNRLFLHNNSLSTIPTGVFDNLPALERLRLDANPLRCDCNLKWFAEFAKEAVVSSAIQLSAICYSPEKLANQSVALLQDNICDEDVYFVEEPSDADVTPGGTILFSCSVKRHEKLVEQVSWSKDGEALEADDRIQILLGGTLLIADARNQDIGAYKCHVDHLSSRAARVRFYRGRSKPTILHSPKHTNVEKGTTIRLNCVASGFPQPSFAWYKDGGRLSTAHSRYKIETNGTLVITNAQLADSGHYRCSASNYLGRASSAAKVKVNLDVPEAAPVITTRPRDAEINEEMFVEFTCIASGQPSADITWWNNNRMVTSHGYIHVSNGGQHLRLEDARPHDSGLYTCRAENKLGRVEASARLKVKSRSRPLELIVAPHDMTAPRGTTIQMPCRAQGSPKPRIKWLKDEQDMTSPRFDIRPDGSLVVENVSEEDEGMYQCIADNGIERKSAHARLSIRRQPRQSAEYQVDQAADGDEFVLVSLEEATRDVDQALNSTLEKLFSTGKSITNSTPGELLKIFRFPPEDQRGVARAAEIFERTLELVADKVRAKKSLNAEEFQYEDLVSPFNLELIANVSGCEAHRVSREVNCSLDMCFHAKYRSIDGTCNNFQKPLQGASLTAFRRLLPANYENHFNTPMGWNADKLYNGFPLPQARQVSSDIITTASITEDDQISHMVMQWGQFLDHDMDHSMEAISRETFENGITCGATCHNQPPCFPIQVSSDDPRIGTDHCIEFTRSSAACGSGDTSVFFHKLLQREQLNQPTSFIDASQVYGSTLDLSISLRNLTNDFGRLREGLGFNYGKPLLPFNARHVIDCRRDPRESNIGCFLTGDVRANEQLGLTAMHTLWFREHNRLASRLRQLNPHWDGDKLYEEARKIVGAQMQVITYEQWLPLILGQEGMQKMGAYPGYQASVDASISNVFAASAFRFGHTLVQPVLRRLDAELQPIPEGDLPLHQAFFAPWRIVQEGGIDPILRGLFASPAKKNLPHQILNNELTEKLFGKVHSIALDLGALNIQRGRDHGLPSYVEWRKFCGLDANAIEDWTTLASTAIHSASIVQKLRQLYGHPGNIDLWVGGLLEEPLGSSRVGPTVQCLLVDQFRRLRNGDRFWYENPSTFAPGQLAQIRQSSLARVICDNGDGIQSVYPNAFKMDQSLVGCENVPEMSLLPWKETNCQEENEEHKTRSRRSIAGDSQEDPSGERVEGLEVIIMKNKLEMSKIQRRLNRLYKAMVKLTSLVVARSHQKDSVCIDYRGTLRDNGDSWLHQDPSSKSCARCACTNHQILCQRVQECVLEQ